MINRSGRRRGVQTQKPVLEREVPRWARLFLIGGAFVTLLWWERRRPLRRRIERDTLRHDARNLAVATLSALAVQAAERPIVGPLSRRMHRERRGLLKQITMPDWLEVALAVALMDYTLYLWHVLTHKVPVLWRFHLPHHVDLDLTATTGLRFHFGEMLISIAWRATQVRVIGVPPLGLSAWQTLTILSVMFHHSNAWMPPGVERWVSRFVVTPRMHGIHHSAVADETNSNWSSGLTIWDYLHGTLRLDIPQEAITIGVPAYRELEDVKLPHVVAMPFESQRDDWRGPDGRRVLSRSDRRRSAAELPPPDEPLVHEHGAPRRRG